MLNTTNGNRHLARLFAFHSFILLFARLKATLLHTSQSQSVNESPRKQTGASQAEKHHLENTHQTQRQQRLHRSLSKPPTFSRCRPHHPRWADHHRRRPTISSRPKSTRVEERCWETSTSSRRASSRRPPRTTAVRQSPPRPSRAEAAAAAEACSAEVCPRCPVSEVAAWPEHPHRQCPAPRPLCPLGLPCLEWAMLQHRHLVRRLLLHTLHHPHNDHRSITPAHNLPTEAEAEVTARRGTSRRTLNCRRRPASATRRRCTPAAASAP